MRFGGEYAPWWRNLAGRADKLPHRSDLLEVNARLFVGSYHRNRRNTKSIGRRPLLFTVLF